MKQGFTTIGIFMAVSGLKYHSAQRYLDRLSFGSEPKLKRRKIGNAYQYFPLQK